MQTFIRLNLAILLALITLFALFMAGLFIAGYAGAYKTVRFFRNTSCSTMIEDLRTQDPVKANTYGEAFQSTGTKGVMLIDERLGVSKTPFITLVQRCFESKDASLRDAMVSGSNNYVAETVTDLFNTMDGQMRKPNPMAAELYSAPVVDADFTSTTESVTEVDSEPTFKPADAEHPVEPTVSKTETKK